MVTYIAMCLASVLAQTYGDFEAICVDDGATDSSHKILLDYAMRDKRIKILVQENKGLSGARNTGLDAAHGEWITFLDSDDFLPPHALETFIRVAEESGEKVVVSAYYDKDSSSQTSLAAPPRWERKSPALKNLVGKRKMQSSAWNKFYHADLLKSRRFIEGIYFEDWPFVTELFGDIESFALVHAPCYVYCTNGDAASIVRSPFNRRTLLKPSNSFRKRLPRNRLGHRVVEMPPHLENAGREEDRLQPVPGVGLRLQP